MKKLFLAVALVAASLSAGAASRDISFSYYSFAAEAAATVANGTSFGSGAVTVTAGSGNGVTIEAKSGVVFELGNSGSLDSVKTYNRLKFATGYASADVTKQSYISIGQLTVPAGATYTLKVWGAPTGAPAAGTARGLALFSTSFASPLNTVEFSAAPSERYNMKCVQISLSEGTYSAGTYKVAGYGGGMLIMGIDFASSSASVNNAISSDILKKAGDALVNPTALSVEVYSVTGVKVLTSAKTSINVSELPQGVYVAKTAKGSLKFIK
jgi:hypothetical protein